MVSAALPVDPGSVIAGKYRVERVIGRGGVGVVASAHHIALRQSVALKFLRPEFAREPQIVQRFLREAQAAAQIRSEHVARVMDATVLDDGTAFLVMEYLEGRDLASVVAEDGPLAVDAASNYILQACDAIGEAHARGMIHRDLKPANLFLTARTDGTPLVKVLDFGLIKVAPLQSSAAITADNHIIGSPHFMSPEQMRSSRDVDVRTDIWALGVTLYVLLTGTFPFNGSYLTEICAAVMSGNPRPISTFRNDVPPAFEALVLRCLEREVHNRVASIAELAVALSAFASGDHARLAERIARVVSAPGVSVSLSPSPGPNGLLAHSAPLPRALQNAVSQPSHADAPLNTHGEAPAYSGKLPVDVTFLEAEVLSATFGPTSSLPLGGPSPVAWSVPLAEVRPLAVNVTSAAGKADVGAAPRPTATMARRHQRRGRWGVYGGLAIVLVAAAVGIGIKSGPRLMTLAGVGSVGSNQANARVPPSSAEAVTPMVPSVSRPVTVPSLVYGAAQTQVDQSRPVSAPSPARTEGAGGRAAREVPGNAHNDEAHRTSSGARGAAAADSGRPSAPAITAAPSRPMSDEELIRSLPH